MKLKIAFALLVVFLSPNLFFPESAKYLVHDNLNSNNVWYKNLAESGMMWAGNKEIIPITHHGIERGCYPSQFYFIPWLYVLFSPLLAYNINIILIRLIAFFGMWLLLRRHLIKEPDDEIPAACALLFAMLPFLPGSGITVAGQPLLLYALLNVLKRKHTIYDYLILGFFPFYSSFFFGNVFLILALVPLTFFYLRKNKELNSKIWFALAYLFVISLAMQYRLIQMKYLEHFESNREDVMYTGLNMFGLIKTSFLHFLKGHYHFHSYQFPATVLLALVNAVMYRRTVYGKWIIALLVAAMCISFITFLSSWTAFMNSFGFLMPPFQLRFQSMSPLIWTLVLAFCFSLLSLSGNWQRNIVRLVMILLIGWSFFPADRRDYYGNEFAENSFYHAFMNNGNKDYQTFDEYYKTSLFQEITKNIPRDEYVACVGFDSEVAQYHGYKTIGGYYAYYSKKYQDEFESIVRGELNKTGARLQLRKCVMYSADLVAHKTTIDNPAWNFEKLKEMDCRVIFSTVKIESTSLTLTSIFKNERDSVFVYVIEAKK